MAVGWVSMVEQVRQPRSTVNSITGADFEGIEKKGNERCKIIFSPQAAGRRPFQQSHGY